MAKVGRKPRTMVFGYADLAEATGLAEPTVRVHVHRGLVDPDDLASVARYVARFRRDLVTREQVAEKMGEFRRQEQQRRWLRTDGARLWF